MPSLPLENVSAAKGEAPTTSLPDPFARILSGSVMGLSQRIEAAVAELS